MYRLSALHRGTSMYRISVLHRGMFMYKISEEVHV